MSAGCCSRKPRVFFAKPRKPPRFFVVVESKVNPTRSPQKKQTQNAKRKKKPFKKWGKRALDRSAEYSGWWRVTRVSGCEAECTERGARLGRAGQAAAVVGSAGTVGTLVATGLGALGVGPLSGLFAGRGGGKDARPTNALKVQEIKVRCWSYFLQGFDVTDDGPPLAKALAARKLFFFFFFFFFAKREAHDPRRTPRF